MKLGGCKCKISHSQQKIEQIQEQVIVAFLSPLLYTKQSMTPIYLLWWIKNSRSRTIKYSCKLTPGKINKVISQINHTQHLHSKYWQPDNADLVHQLRIRRQIETSGLQVHKISFTTKNRTKVGMFFFCLSPLFWYIFCGHKI